MSDAEWGKREKLQYFPDFMCNYTSKYCQTNVLYFILTDAEDFEPEGTPGAPVTDKWAGEDSDNDVKVAGKHLPAHLSVERLVY